MANVIEGKSFDLAVRIVKLYQMLSVEKREYILSKQMLRCGASIGANVAEALKAQSRADFISKMNIALKEAAELKYWLRLLHATDYLPDAVFRSLYSDSTEVEKILSSIIKTSKG